MHRLPQLNLHPAASRMLLIIFTSSDLAAMQQTIELIQAKGGCAAHVFPPSALIGSLEPEQADLLIANGQLRAVYREILDGPRMDHVGR